MRCRVGVVLVALVALPSCSNPVEMVAVLPTELDGIGTLSDDCVQSCRDLYGSCGRLRACYSVTGSRCESLEVSECTAACGERSEVDAALSEVGCSVAYIDYQVCIQRAVVIDGVCELRDEHCGAEWGVYAACAGFVD